MIHDRPRVLILDDVGKPFPGLQALLREHIEKFEVTFGVPVAEVTMGRYMSEPSIIEAMEKAWREVVRSPIHPDLILWPAQRHTIRWREKKFNIWRLQ